MFAYRYYSVNSKELKGRGHFVVREPETNKNVRGMTCMLEEWLW